MVIFHSYVAVDQKGNPYVDHHYPKIAICGGFFVWHFPTQMRSTGRSGYLNDIKPQWLMVEKCWEPWQQKTRQLQTLSPQVTQTSKEWQTGVDTKNMTWLHSLFEVVTHVICSYHLIFVVCFCQPRERLGISKKYLQLMARHRKENTILMTLMFGSNLRTHP